MRSIDDLQTQLALEADDDTFVEAVEARVQELLSSRASVPCAKQLRRANAFLCHAIRCARQSRAAVGCIARPCCKERTLTNGHIFDVGKILCARPTLLEMGSFVTLVRIVNCLGHEKTVLCQFKGKVHTYDETRLAYPEWCGLERSPTT